MPDSALFYMIYFFNGFTASTLKELLACTPDLYDSMMNLCTAGYQAIQPIVTSVTDEVDVVVTIFGSDGSMALATLDGVDVTALLDLVM